MKKTGQSNCCKLAPAFNVITLLLVLLLSACSIGSPDASTVQKVADQFFLAQQQQDFDTAVKFYSDNRSPEAWRSHLENISGSLGNIESYQFKRMEVNTVLSGRLYIFEYEVSYSSGKNAKETLTLFDTVESDDVTGIVSHVISADGFKPLF